AETRSGGRFHFASDVDSKRTNTPTPNTGARAMTLPGSRENAGAASAAGEIHGRVENTRLTGNTVNVSSAASDGFGLAGASILFGSVSNSIVQGNHVQVSSPNGEAVAWGGGRVA